MFVSPNTFKQSAYNAFIPILIADNLFRTLLISSYLAICLMISMVEIDVGFLVFFTIFTAAAYCLTYIHLGIANYLRLYFDLEELELSDDVKVCREAYRVVVGRVNALVRTSTVIVMFTAGMTVFCVLGSIMNVHEHLLDIAIWGNLASSALLVLIGVTGAYRYTTVNFVSDRLEDLSFPHLRIMLNRVKRQGV